MGNFRYGAYLTSQYAWVLILGSILCIQFFLPANHDTGIIHSKTTFGRFSSSSLPTIISHLTDIHINHNVPESKNRLVKSLEILKRIQPDLNIITGDQSDNFGSDHMPRYGDQRPEDFDLYKNLTKLFKHIEIDGNHDLFGVYDYKSKKKLNSSEVIDDYYISVHDFEIQSKNYSFVLMNPYHFPSPHPPLLFYAHTTTHFLDLLELAIKNIPETNEIIALSHFPVYHYFGGEKSTQDNSFQSIITSGRIGFFISGHLHINTPSYQHHGPLLEIVGSDLTSHKKMALIIIDNERLSYHPIDTTQITESTILGFVTNPLENEVLSNHQIFNEINTYLRVVVYSPVEPNITASGAVNGRLNCTKHKFWLCQKEMNLDFGHHSITLNGDMNKTIDFTVANSIPSYKEPIYQKETALVYPYFIQMAVLYCFLAIIIIPIKISSIFVDRYQLWITNVNDNVYWWLFSIFAGFIAVKIRIQSLPWFFKIALLVALIWPLCLPTLFITIEGHIGIVWTWGYICDGIQHYGVWGQYLTLFYLAAILLPLTLLCSTVAVSNPCHWSFIFDLLFQMIGLFAIVILFLRFANEATGMARSFLSPMFFIIPAFFYISTIVWRFYIKKSLGDTRNIILTQALID